MNRPERWTDYLCEDYFSSPLAVDGYWDESAQFWIIVPGDRVEEEAEVGFLQVGAPGVDLIGFGYRREEPGFWALHRMTGREFQYLAPTVGEFLDGWFAGRITV